MSWNWTLTTAVVGAVTGSYGAVTATLGRLDVRWRRAAKQVPDVRQAVEVLRDAVATVQLGDRPLSSLRANDLRANLDLVQDVRTRLSDKKLAESLVALDQRYSTVLALGDDSPAHKRTAALSAAGTAIEAALARVAEIERKAPP